MFEGKVRNRQADEIALHANYLVWLGEAFRRMYECFRVSNRDLSAM